MQTWGQPNTEDTEEATTIWGQQNAVQATSGTGQEPRYWPIRDYAVIGDCRTAALIAPNGSIDWLCMPHFDSPAVLLRLLDADKGGNFRVRQSGSTRTRMSYLPETNIVETMFDGQDGRLRLVDFMPIRKRAPANGGGGGLLDQAKSLLGQQSPTAASLAAGDERELGNDVAAAHRITRIATCQEGDIHVEAELRVTFDYARQAAQITPVETGHNSVAAILTAGGRYLVFFARREPSLAPDGGERTLALDMQGDTLRVNAQLLAGHQISFALNYARSEAEARQLLGELVTHDYERDFEETLTYWRAWSATNRYTGPYQTAIMRSALALKLCTFEPTGAIVAAPTTSLPEGIGGVRNWDYRYTWIRDSSFTLNALGQLGYSGEARDYFHFLHDLQIKSGADLRIMYGIRGERGQQIEEHLLTSLEGYQGSKPVRIGNGAALQKQLDVYGELLDAAYAYLENGGYRAGARRDEPLRDLRELSQVIATYVQGHWQDVDRGIWEVRGDPRPFVYSRAMCWVALDRASKMAAQRGQDDEAQGWRQAADAIHADVLAHGYSQAIGSFTQSYGDAVLDASNLRIPIERFLPWADPRIGSTVDATKRYLTGEHGLVYRYRISSAQTPTPPGATQRSSQQTTDDGLPGTEGAFTACTFWLIGALCHLGRVDEARQRFEQLLEFASPLGLFSEELDPSTGEQLGNFPQAFTHIGLINAAVVLQQAQEGRLTADAGMMSPR